MSFNNNKVSSGRGYKKTDSNSANTRRSSDNRLSRSNPNEDRFSHKPKEPREMKDNLSDEKRAFAEKKSNKGTSAPFSSDKEKIENDGTMRLNRFIANAGVCSRREADLLIQKGLVSVNGKITTELGTIVKITDKIIYNQKELNSEKKIYVLLNKPKDVVTSREDEQARLTVLDLVRNACVERIYPVGRLDKNTTGVLLLTNDGELTKKLTHPKYEHKKIYHVHLDKAVTKAHIESISTGIKLEDGLIIADSVEYVDNDKNQVGIEIHSGRNRIVRRIFEHLGYKVMKLDRVYFAGLTKKGLQRSHWRHLTDQEVKLLKAGLLT